MNTWIALILRTDGAKASMLEWLAAEIAKADSLAAIDSLEKLHLQRGFVAGLQHIRFTLKNPPTR